MYYIFRLSSPPWSLWLLPHPNTATNPQLQPLPMELPPTEWQSKSPLQWPSWRTTEPRMSSEDSLSTSRLRMASPFPRLVLLMDQRAPLFNPESTRKYIGPVMMSKVLYLVAIHQMGEINIDDRLIHTLVIFSIHFLMMTWLVSRLCTLRRGSVHSPLDTNPSIYV